MASDRLSLRPVNSALQRVAVYETRTVSASVMQLVFIVKLFRIKENIHCWIDQRWKMLSFAENRPYSSSFLWSDDGRGREGLPNE